MSRDPKFYDGLTVEERLLRAIFGAPEPDPCNECNRPVTGDDAAPSCGAHILHIECREWFRCRECALVWDEASA